MNRVELNQAVGIQTQVHSTNDINDELFNLFKKNSVTKAEVVALIQRGAEVNVVDDYGWTPLMHAAWNGHDEAINPLIENGAEKNAENKGKMTALMLASWHGKTKAVKALINNNVDINRDKDGKMSALMLASWAGRTDVVRLLLESNAHINAQYVDGRTALMFASWGGHLDTVKLLVERDANIHLVNNDTAKRNALMFALSNEKNNVAEYLKSKNATINEVNYVDPDMTPLMSAAFRGNLEKINQLLGENVDVEKRYKPEKRDGRTAIMWAAWAGRLDAVKLLKEKGNADPHAIDTDTRSVLMWAARSGKTDVARYLKNECNVKFAKRTDDGFTAFMYASAFGYDSLALELAA